MQDGQLRPDITAAARQISLLRDAGARAGRNEWRSMRESEQILTELVPMSARLEAIAALAGHGDTVCDVGCDHAHVPIRLLQTRCYRRAIGMDVIEGPLGKAAGNLALYGMRDRVELRLSDGLDAYTPGEAGTLVITGMGGTLMEDILLREPQKTASFQILVLGPQSDPEKVRAALRRLAFVITQEQLIYEDGKYYPVIRAESGIKERSCTASFAAEVPDGICREAEDMFGPVLLEERDPVLLEFLMRRTVVLEKIVRSIRQAAREAAQDTCREPELRERHLVRQKEIEHSLTVFYAALTVYDKPWREL